MSLKTAAFITVGVIVLIGTVFYREVEKNTAEKASVNIVPKVGADSVSEVGYVFGARDKILFSDRIRDVRWWVKVPETDKRWACSWEGGFHAFEEGDGVIIIHKVPRPQEVNWDGYIVGLHGKEKGKVAMVWALDLDEIELDQLYK